MTVRKPRRNIKTKKRAITQQTQAAPLLIDALVPFEQIQAVADKIGRAFNPNRIILFGSYARGEQTANSDVDLLVVLDGEWDGNTADQYSAAPIRTLL
jgi:signal-transduction protein with cAMP-binding, CBS, and nucleotidyltransferase domain